MIDCSPSGGMDLSAPCSVLLYESAGDLPLSGIVEME